ncbi:non-canonical poly(A) RNA polymerase PAPD5 isoform X2 [Carica papaya]|uniref:non-canonical poly(A) RNA polymerase PAPD5 isoform X2 n=1 Tax=Carica papaya TaxID=3649 RepID=UPI000B8D04F7|nr:non-canonical poly(A) RNA polymerase PAPD5 isoform X2 [Carica papaya]
MDPQTEPKTPVYLYETLSPLAVSPVDQSPLSAQLLPFRSDRYSPRNQSPEPYSVLRNEISSSKVNFSSEEAAAPDYFSLEVGDGSEERTADGLDETEPRSPLPQPKKSRKKKKSEADMVASNEAEPRLELAWFRGNRRLKSPMLQLHKEEEASRTAAVECVFDVIKYIWPNCKVEVFGSFSTGLYLPTSDVDVVILKSGIKNPQTGLQALARALAQRGIAKKIQVIAKARVPIIKFVEKKSGVPFDISFDAQNGPKAAEFIKDSVLKWPPLRPLCLILKVFLQQRELNEVYSGGIGSYALLAMLMAMLQNHQESRTLPEHNLGILLINFLDFYGRKLNTVDVGVSCKGKGTFFVKNSKGFSTKGRPFLISIEDPQMPENDIGKNSFNYFQIKSAFATAFSTLTNPKIILSLGPNRSILGTIIRPDPILLERKGGLNGEVTFSSLLPGAGEPLQSDYGVQPELLCNWQFDEEEPLPRGDVVAANVSAESSGRKRKVSSKDKSRKKKVNENEEVGNQENSLRKERSAKKKPWRHNNGYGDANGFSH